MTMPKMPQRFDLNEISEVTKVLRSNRLWYWPPDGSVGHAVEAVKKQFGVNYVATTSSGTASLHTAVAAAQIPAGAEVITSPITDPGTVFGILFQNAIPVFADVDINTSNITAESISKVITDKTKAVLVVHLTGSPADLEPIATLCKERNLILIEDCAQALGATYKGKQVGTQHDFGCFSVNDQKHITCGEGGFVITNTEDRFYLCHNHADKYYDRYKRGQHLVGMGPNYRMSEIDGAMLLAQLPKLQNIAALRQTAGDHLAKRLASIKGLIPPQKAPDSTCTYFYFQFRVDEDILGFNRDELLKRLVARGLAFRGGYCPWPMYQAPVFKNKAFFYGGVWPAEVVSGRSYDYNSISLPNAERALETTLSFSLHQGYSIEDVDSLVKVIEECCR